MYIQPKYSYFKDRRVNYHCFSGFQEGIDVSYVSGMCKKTTSYITLVPLPLVNSGWLIPHCVWFKPPFLTEIKKTCFIIVSSLFLSNKNHKFSTSSPFLSQKHQITIVCPICFNSDSWYITMLQWIFMDILNISQ